MENNTAIKIVDLKKIFRYFKKDYKVFYWLFTRKGFTKEFKVINGLNLEIKKGEVVGILGKNGAGKSTLLKLISGIYFPTSGKVEVNGTIASLIELGAGFNRELTGRENIYLKGTLLGLSNKFIDDNIDAMISFADIGEYIDMPLGTYSSGMSARLGFALAVNADPDILIIDEVFAVGDKNFQKKSREKTEELLKSGKTVLFVSHSEALISEFCDRVVYLKNGKIVYDGNVERGLATYHADNLNLPKIPMLKYLDSDIIMNEEGNNPLLSLRFEFGIGAGEQLISNDKIDNFDILVSKIDSSENTLMEENFTSIVKLEKISDSVLELYIDTTEIVGVNNFTIVFNHSTSKNRLVYVPAINIDQNSDQEKFGLQGFIRNSNSIFVYEMKTIA